MNYLASPPLVVAYALAGSIDVDLDHDPLGHDPSGAPVLPARPLADGDGGRAGGRVGARSARCSRRATRRFSTATSTGGRSTRRPATATHGIRSPRTSAGRRSSRASTATRRRRATSTGARVLALLGDSVTTDHISPAGVIRRGQSRRRTGCRSTASSPLDFNSYGSRRGNHEVMVRGTFANVRLRNRLAPGTEGGVTVHLPDGDADDDLRRGDAVRERGRAARRARGQGVRLGLVARLGGQGFEAARRPGRARRELRAHPPLEPRRDGRAAARVPRRARRSSRSG